MTDTFMAIRYDPRGGPVNPDMERLALRSDALVLAIQTRGITREDARTEMDDIERGFADLGIDLRPHRRDRLALAR